MMRWMDLIRLSMKSPGPPLGKMQRRITFLLVLGFADFGLDMMGGLQNGKHLFGMSLPFVHNIFNGDFGGFENTSGIGDLKMRYAFVPFAQNSGAGLQRVSTYFEVTAPTGDDALGRGAGSWLFKPGVIASIKPNPYLSFYPEAKLQISASEANNQGGGDGAPDPNDPEKDGRTQSLSLSVPAVLLVNSWNGLDIAQHNLYIFFSEETYFLFLRTDFGKMIGERTAVALNISKFIAGEPRLDVLVQLRLQIFIR